MYDTNYNENVVQIKRLKKKTKSPEETINENFESWVGFWRANPHRFITDYLGLRLYDFQKVLICLMDRYPTFLYAASRGLAKVIGFLGRQLPGKNGRNRWSSLVLDNTEITILIAKGRMVL